jgi:CheY-like chemotaxis protein
MAKIVVLEDDASTRRLITAVLKKSGHEVTDVDNGAEGLLIVLADQPDLVVSDVEMPKLTGFEVLQNIRQEPSTADTPVILLTSLSSRADMRKGMSQGADDYITKPFQPQELIDAVDAQLARLANRRSAASPVLRGFAESAVAEMSLAPLPDLPTLSLEETPEQAGAAFDMQAAEQSAPPLKPSRAVGNAWALNLCVMNDETVRTVLPIKEWRMVLRQLFLPVSKDAALRSADFLDLRDSSLSLYILDQTQDGRQGHERAALAVEAMVRTGANCRQWALAQFPALSNVPPRVVVSLHFGPIEVVSKPLDFGGERDTVIGPTADLLARMRQGGDALLWRVAATEAAVAAAQGVFRLGANRMLDTDAQDVKVHALMGLNGHQGGDDRVEAAAWL